MRFRFTYSAAGMTDFVATDPGGWDTASIGFERDSKLLSLVEFFKSSFTTYGTNNQPVQYDGTRMIDGGRDWLLQAEALNGADSQITQLVEIDENNTLNWEYFFQSVLSINEFLESMKDSHLLGIVCSQQDFWAKFVKRFNQPVDLKSLLDLDGNAVTAVPSFILPLPSQIIDKSYSAYLNQPGFFPTNFIHDGPDFAVNNFIQLDMDQIDLDEIDTTAKFPTSINLIKPPSKFIAVFGGDYKFNLRIEASGATGVTRVKGKTYVRWYIQKDDEAAILFTENDFGVAPYESTVHTYVGTITLNPNDQVYIYGLIVASITPLGGGDPFYQMYSMQTIATPSGAGSGSGNKPCYYKTTAETTFKDTSTDAFLTYNVIKGIIDRICGAPFKSDYLGNPYTSDVYGAVGCGSNLANMLGLHLRGYLLADKPFQLSAQDWHDGINPIHCLGIGYEDVGGITKIVCERAEHFFDDSNVSVNFLNIYDIKRSYDQEWQFNSLNFGYQKWESQAATGIGVPSGIDDPQSQKIWTNIFKFIGKELKQLSRFVTASLTTEQTRRVGINKNSNYTYDNDIFAIKLHDPGAGTYVPETDQPFSAITNLLNSSTRYNSDLTPARNLLRWAKYWSGCLQDYVGSAIKYASGVGNFLMTSTKTTSCDGDDTGNVVAENGDFVVGNDYLFFPMPLEINHKLDWTTYKYLRDHKNWAITISQTDVVGMKAFIKSLEYKKAKGEVKMIVWPKGRYVIEKIESVATGEGVVPGIKYFEIPEFASEFE